MGAWCRPGIDFSEVASFVGTTYGASGIAMHNNVDMEQVPKTQQIWYNIFAGSEEEIMFR